MKVKALWDKVPFSRGRDPATIQSAVTATDHFVHAWDGVKLIGTARVLTDGAYYATLWDVIVDPDYQNHGVGRALVERAVEQYVGRGFAFIALFSAEGKEGFYERLGFGPRPRGMNLNEAQWALRVGEPPPRNE